MLGLGRMGANMVRRLMNDGHECVVTDMNQSNVDDLVKEGAIGSTDTKDFISKLSTPRAIWIMVPAGVVDSVLEDLSAHLSPGDIIIDGGNSYYKDDLRRAKSLATKNIHYVDCGTSGGVWGLERGYCLMIGGEKDIVNHLDSIFKTIAPGVGNIDRTIGCEGEYSAAEHGYLHCGPNGAGHYVKMVHNGIEYGLMAAYGEGLNILKHANVGNEQQDIDAESSPLENPDDYKYDLNLADVSEVWRRGSVISSWLLDLTAISLKEDAELTKFAGRVSDSGEGRWTSIAAIETGAPSPVLTTALYSRFTSRGESGFDDKLLSAMRYQFGGHNEKPNK